LATSLIDTIAVLFESAGFSLITEVKQVIKFEQIVGFPMIESDNNVYRIENTPV